MSRFAFWCVVTYGWLEAVHWLVMARLTEEKTDHANFVFVNGLTGFLPLAVVNLAYVGFVGMPSINGYFWMFVFISGILQCIGLNGITQAARGGKLTWLLSLDSISPVVLAGFAYFAHHQELKHTGKIGVCVIAAGLVVQFQRPTVKTTDTPPPDNPLPRARDWRSRLRRFFARSAALYLLSRLVWMPYPPAVQEVSYSVSVPPRHRWAVPAFTMAPVFLLGAIISFWWKCFGSQKERFSEQAQSPKWYVLVQLAGVSAWRYFVRFWKLFALNACILTSQQFAEITALTHANVGAVSAVLKSTVVFRVLMQTGYVIYCRTRKRAYERSDLSGRQYFGMVLLTVGAFVMAR